jgi:cell wall-associated NlpC family hydrolase
LAAVQARIAQIQHQLAPAVPSTSTSSSAASADPLTRDDFQSALSGALAQYTGTATGGIELGSSSARKAFVTTALAERGKPYRWGAEASSGDADPTAFDCSELTEWAAARAGVKIPDGAVAQYLQAKNGGTLMSVDEALRTPGALLFSFDHEPKGPGDIPTHSHVAISLGNGQTIEARGRKYGTGVFDGKNRFNYAGMIPGMV